VESKVRLQGASHPTTKIVFVIAANVHAAAGSYEDALRYRRRALAIAEQYPEDHPEFLPGLAGLVGQDLVALGRYDEAEQALMHAAELAKAHAGEDPSALALVEVGLGNLELERRRYDAASTYYEGGVAKFAEASPNRAIALANLALARASMGRFEDALAHASEAVALVTSLGPDSGLRLGLECYAAEVDRLAGRTDRAREEFGRIVKALDRVPIDPESRFIALFGAARLEPDRDRAAALARQAKEALAALPPVSARHADFAEWSAAHEAVR
jgi:tetratricopeptide (TPR) repeat protein